MKWILWFALGAGLVVACYFHYGLKLWDAPPWEGIAFLLWAPITARVLGLKLYAWLLGVDGVVLRRR